MKSSIFDKFIFVIAILGGLVSCDKEQEGILLDINDYTFYFLIEGKKYLPNDTLYLEDSPNGIVHVEVCNEENEKIRGYIECERDGSVSLSYNEDYDTGEHYRIEIKNAGKGTAHFTMGRSEHFYQISDGAGNLYPEFENGKEIILNIFSHPIAVNTLKQNMRLTVERVGLNVYIKLIADNLLSHLALGYYKDENNNEYYSDGRFEVKRYGTLNYSYEEEFGRWKKHDEGYKTKEYYAYFQRLIGTNGIMPDEYFISFSYANKEYTVWGAKYSNELIWEINNTKQN